MFGPYEKVGIVGSQLTHYANKPGPGGIRIGYPYGILGAAGMGLNLGFALLLKMFA